MGRVLCGAAPRQAASAVACAARLGARDVAAGEAGVAGEAGAGEGRGAGGGAGAFAAGPRAGAAARARLRWT